MAFAKVTVTSKRISLIRIHQSLVLDRQSRFRVSKKMASQDFLGQFSQSETNTKFAWVRSDAPRFQTLWLAQLGFLTISR